MLKDGRAVIYKYQPFTIQLTYKTTNHTQDIEFCSDCGYQYEGISVKSEKHEYVSLQADMLDDEKNRHDDRRKYRRTRRNRKRYRKPRFNNRIKNKKAGWLAPSLKNRMDNQVRLYERFIEVCPITKATVEVGSFDTQVMEAIEKGDPIPEGKDYQHGARYGFDTLREAVFYRDGYKCQVCGKSPFTTPNLIIVTHHALYWKGDHTDRMASLMTLCTDCHTSANHQKSGLLWGLEPEKSTSNKAGAAFMNVVRWKIRDKMSEYCIGDFRPKHRTQEVHIIKRRRNDRCLEKFRDAVYIDSRDSEEKKGKELSSGRTKRKEPRHGANDQRQFRKLKVSKGVRCIRKKRYEIQSGDTVLYDGKTYIVNGMQNKGTTVSLNATKTVSLNDIQPKYTKDKKSSLPIEVGQKLNLKGKKTKRKILSIDSEYDTAIMEWPIGVKLTDVKPLTHAYGGWTLVI